MLEDASLPEMSSDKAQVMQQLYARACRKALDPSPLGPATLPHVAYVSVRVGMHKTHSACVDLVDYARVSAHAWVRKHGVLVTDSLPKISMGMLVMETTYKVDNVNGNRMDNRRINLRIRVKDRCPIVKVSRYVGVHRRGALWYVSCAGNDIGAYITEDDAARAYNLAYVRTYGLDHPPNIIPGDAIAQPEEEATIIALRGETIRIDADMLEPLSRGYIGWRINTDGRVVSVKTCSSPQVALHRVVCKVGRNVFIIHKNGDYLDNRRSNLIAGAVRMRRTIRYPQHEPPVKRRKREPSDPTSTSSPLLSSPPPQSQPQPIDPPSSIAVNQVEPPPYGPCCVDHGFSDQHWIEAHTSWLMAPPSDKSRPEHMLFRLTPDPPYLYEISNKHL